MEAGMSRGLAAKWKSTKTEKPSAEALEKMSAYFGISIDEILGIETKNPATIGDEVQIAASKYDLLNDANKAFIDEMIEKLIKSQSAE
jgi:transcriptional regulator with XRE-family HTH domain